MAIIEPTVDHIDDETLMRELRNLAGAVDKNETALNNEMAQISQRQDQIEDTVAGFEDQITENTSDITDIKQNITTIEQDITAVENKNNEQDTAISQNETAIENEVVARQNADEAETEARQQADITGASLSVVSGAIQLMLNRALGAINANVTAPFIKTMELIPTATERAFKLRITYWDNTQYDTNDFVIPAGGGTDVSVTGVTIQNGTTPNSFQVQIELSDGTPISSNDYPFPEATVSPYPTSVTLGLSGTTLSVSVGLNNSTSVSGNVNLAPILANLQEQISGLKLSTDGNNMTLNGDSVQIVKTVTGSVSGNNLTIGVNGVNSSVITLPSGENWEELDLSNLPTDFNVNDIIAVSFCIDVNLSVNSWSSAISNYNIISGETNSDFKFFKIESNAQALNTLIGIKVLNNSSAIVENYIDSILGVNSWNTDALFEPRSVAFNGKGSNTAYSLTIRRNNVNQYINSIYRIRSN